MEPPLQRQWYIDLDGNRRGPLNVAELRRELAEGTLSPQQPLFTSLEAPQSELSVSEALRTASDPTYFLFDTLRTLIDKATISRRQSSRPDPSLTVVKERDFVQSKLFFYAALAVLLITAFTLWNTNSNTPDDLQVAESDEKPAYSSLGEREIDGPPAPPTTSALGRANPLLRKPSSEMGTLVPPSPPPPALVAPYRPSAPVTEPNPEAFAPPDDPNRDVNNEDSLVGDPLAEHPDSLIAPGPIVEGANEIGNQNRLPARSGFSPG